MKKSLIAGAVVLGLMSATASATQINIRHEFTPRYDGQKEKHRDRIAVSHRFNNGIGFEVEAKWRSNTRSDGSEDAFNEFAGNGQQANISYRHRLNDSFTLTPQYKWESGSDKMGHQFNLTLGYKVNSDWSTSFRHRYHYENKVRASNSHYNRWTFAASYSGVTDWQFGASVDYTFNESASGPRYKDNQSWFSEFNTTAEYRGFESGWRPFTELGMVPYKSGDYIYEGKSQNDSWRPRVRVGMKYSW